MTFEQGQQTIEQILATQIELQVTLNHCCRDLSKKLDLKVAVQQQLQENQAYLQYEQVRLQDSIEQIQVILNRHISSRLYVKSKKLQLEKKIAILENKVKSIKDQIAHIEIS